MSQTKFTMVNILASMLILSSAIWMFSPYGSYTFYKGEFEYLSNSQALLRYGISALGRLLGFVAGVGILYRKNICRKLAIFLCSVTIFIVHWKHPIVLFEKAIGRLPDYNINLHQLGLDPQIFIRLSLYGAYAVDILFAATVIFVLTRPFVVEDFIKNSHS